MSSQNSIYRPKTWKGWVGDYWDKVHVGWLGGPGGFKSMQSFHLSRWYDRQLAADDPLYIQRAYGPSWRGDGQPHVSKIESEYLQHEYKIQYKNRDQKVNCYDTTLTRSSSFLALPPLLSLPCSPSLPQPLSLTSPPLPPSHAGGLPQPKVPVDRGRVEDQARRPLADAERCHADQFSPRPWPWVRQTYHPLDVARLQGLHRRRHHRGRTSRRQHVRRHVRLSQWHARDGAVRSLDVSHWHGNTPRAARTHAARLHPCCSDLTAATSRVPSALASSPLLARCCLPATA